MNHRPDQDGLTRMPAVTEGIQKSDAITSLPDTLKIFGVLLGKKPQPIPSRSF